MARAERVFDALNERRDACKDADRAAGRPVAGAARQSCDRRLRALLPADIDGLNIRHHGDFHLGQMLIVKDDIFIIGFEGEPRRPLEERRRKAPAARDVASLIRSIDYSATAALERALQGGARRARQARSRTRRMARSRHRGVPCRLSRDHGECQRLWPADPQAADRLLNFFLLEKVLYEIEYELAQRPEWLRVPLTGCFESCPSDTDEAS